MNATGNEANSRIDERERHFREDVSPAKKAAALETRSRSIRSTRLSRRSRTSSSRSSDVTPGFARLDQVTIDPASQPRLTGPQVLRDPRGRNPLIDDERDRPTTALLRISSGHLHPSRGTSCPNRPQPSAQRGELQARLLCGDGDTQQRSEHSRPSFLGARLLCGDGDTSMTTVPGSSWRF
jgi:hypothetical protein